MRQLCFTICLCLLSFLPTAAARGTVDTNERTKQHVLAFSALLTEVNSGRHDLLAEYAPDPSETGNSRKILSQWWGINSRQDLLDIFQMLEESGHRSGYREMASETHEKLIALQDDPSTDPEQKEKIKDLLSTWSNMVDKALIGWDFCRYISLCR